MLRITVNGEPREFAAGPAGLSVRHLLDALGLRVAAVERNGEVVPRRLHEETRLKDGDILEVVTFVGGG